jgi:Zn-dependent peptidase ImmA (M78 family)
MSSVVRRGSPARMDRYSRNGPSRLLSLFTQRASGGGANDPESVLKRLLADLRKAVGWSRKRPQLEKAQVARGIRRVEYKTEWDRDGALEPLGTGFAEGFKMTLNARACETRVRFTQAHELCHTYFYEYVPEIKLRPHLEDPAEEQLCDFGAAELLMPERPLRKEAVHARPSVQSLLILATAYHVSPEAMMLRLRRLRLWKGELHLWRYENSGQFSLERVIGAKWFPWKWCDVEIPNAAWTRGHFSGVAYLECDIQGAKKYKVTSFDAKRQGARLIVVTRTAELRSNQYSLFPNSPALDSFEYVQWTR